MFIQLVLVSNQQMKKSKNLENNTSQEESETILKNLEDKIYINIYMEGDLSPNFKLLQSEIKKNIKKI